MALSSLLLVGVASGCAASAPPEPPDPAQMVDSGTWYVHNRWPHDGRPHESASFVVYSDAASSEARHRLADLAEEVLTETTDEMGVDPQTMFRFPADQDKIHLYANRYNVPDWGGAARGYYAGVIIWSFDHEAERRPTGLDDVRPALKHELVHVIEALLKGRFTGDVPIGPHRMPVWFSEGTAEALSGGATADPPGTLGEVDRLIDEFGRINPIAWRLDLRMSESVQQAYAEYYYPMAHLAVEYLLDAEGMGRSPEDLAAVMLDMGGGASFASAFEANIGISESDYEAEFFALMAAYLPQSEFPLEAVGVALLSLLAAALMGGSLIWGHHRWPAAAVTTGAVGGTAWGRRARMGFLAEISAGAVVPVGLAALIFYSLAFAELPPHAQIAPAYLLTFGYLAVTAGVLMWAMRRWADRSRRAFLIPLLVIAVTTVTLVLIGLMV